MITIDPPGSALSLRPADKGALTRFLARARAAAGVAGEIDVLLADDATLRRLNRQFRGKNQATDVLSFSASDEAKGRSEIAGDLAISLEAAARQAAEHSHSLVDEVKILLLHGALHLAGYDHESDAGEMAEAEAKLQAELRLPTGLIVRTRELRGAAREPHTPARQDRARKGRR